MNDNFFLDTNILIYCYSDDDPEKRMISQEKANSSNAIISTQVIQEFANAMTKKQGLSWLEAESYIGEFTNNFHVYLNTPSTLKLGCKIAARYKFHFYDSLIIAAALETSCKILYSEDLQHGQLIENQLTIINPFLNDSSVVYEPETIV